MSARGHSFFLQHIIALPLLESSQITPQIWQLPCKVHDLSRAAVLEQGHLSAQARCHWAGAHSADTLMRLCLMTDNRYSESNLVKPSGVRKNDKLRFLDVFRGRLLMIVSSSVQIVHCRQK